MLMPTTSRSSPGWLAAIALVILASALGACGRNAPGTPAEARQAPPVPPQQPAAPPVDALDASLPPLAYEAALPEGMRSLISTPFTGDFDQMAARCLIRGDLSNKQGRKAAVACARSYREHMLEFSELDPLRLWYAHISADDLMDSVPHRLRKHVHKRVDKALARGGSELAYPELADAVGGQIRIKDQPPLIFHPEGTSTHEFLKTIETQVKQARASVLERFAGKSVYPHHGQRVVMGQRLMQPASDMFLGWVTGRDGRHVYVRQLRDAKIKPAIETFDVEMLDTYAGACGWALARAHAKTSRISPTISGYLGSSDEFDEAMGDFAEAYADQAETDHAALKAAVHKGTIVAQEEDE